MFPQYYDKCVTRPPDINPVLLVLVNHELRFVVDLLFKQANRFEMAPHNAFEIVVPLGLSASLNST